MIFSSPLSSGSFSSIQTELENCNIEKLTLKYKDTFQHIFFLQKRTLLIFTVANRYCSEILGKNTCTLQFPSGGTGSSTLLPFKSLYFGSTVKTIGFDIKQQKKKKKKKTDCSKPATQSHERLLLLLCLLFEQVQCNIKKGRCIAQGFSKWLFSSPGQVDGTYNTLKTVTKFTVVQHLYYTVLNTHIPTSLKQ